MSEEYDESITDKLISVYELAKIDEFLDDEEVKDTIVEIAKLIAKPKIPPNVAVPMMIKLQGYAFNFKEKGKYYMYIGKGEPNASVKKNYYLSFADEIDKLVGVLKFIMKTY